LPTLKDMMKQPSEVVPPPPTTDSTDFTAEEANSAEPAPDSQKWIERIGHLSCPSCGSRFLPKSHAHRRFGGISYSRVKLECQQGHSETRVFRLDWLKGAT
jgi:hypothetical protein